MTFDNARFTSNATRYTYNPLLNSSLGFTITQPLLRGFGIELNRRYIHITKNNAKIADLVFRQQVIDTVAGIARLYTDLVSLNEDVKVKSEASRLAERLYEDNKNKVDQGTLAPIELTRAQAQVAVTRQALLSAQGLVEQQELIVKTVITRGGLANPAIRAAHLIATDTVTVPEMEPGSAVEELIAEAVRNRPDLAQAGMQVQNSQISLNGSLNALRPELDLVGAAQNGALSGDVNAAAVALAPGAALYPGGYGTELGQIFRNNFPSYSVGIQLTLPLRNRVAQADAVRDELQLRQTQTRRQQFEDQVRLEVADAYVAMRQAWAAYQAAVQSRALQEQSVQVEQDTFDVGPRYQLSGDSVSNLSRAGALHRGRRKGRLRKGEACSRSGHGADARSKSGVDSRGTEWPCVAVAGAGLPSMRPRRSTNSGGVLKSRYLWLGYPTPAIISGRHVASPDSFRIHFKCF